jgi:hypothetical protein
MSSRSLILLELDSTTSESSEIPFPNTFGRLIQELQVLVILFSYNKKDRY